MSARSPSKAVALIGAAVMLLTLVPTVAVGDNSAGNPDGLVVVLHPRNAVYEDAGVLMSSVQNAYVFDFELYTAGGAPYHVSKYMVDVHTVDGRSGTPDPDAPFDSTLVWTRTFDLGSAYASEGTLRIPANVLTVRAPEGHEVPFFGGLTVTILPMLDENRQSLLDENFHYPAGQFSLPANEAAAQGDYARADQLDEGFTPIFITHGQIAGLLQHGNPVVNPGFEFFVCDEDTARAATGDAADCSNRPAPNEADVDGKMAIPPWFLRADVADADGDKVPCSLHHINGSSAEGAAALSILYKPCDNGRRLLLGQIISEPGAPLHWEGTQASTVAFSLRVDGASTAPRLGVGVHYEVPTSVDPRGFSDGYVGPFEYPSDGEYHRYAYDLEDAIAGKRILGIYFQFEDSPGTYVAQLDNVVIGGVQLPGDREERTDSTDGYAAFIDVLGDGFLTDAREVSVPAVRLANNQPGYLFRISAMDYTGIAPQPVAVAEKPSVLFQLLDQEYLTSGLDHQTPLYSASLTGADAGRFFPVLDAGGEPTGDLMFVVPGAAAAGKVLVPWTWIDVQPDDSYEPVYSTDARGFASQPVSGYYSPLRNSLRGYGLADSFDYSFAPVNFSATIADTIAYPTTLTLACVNMSSTTRCGDDPSPALTATLATASPYEEPLQVELVSVGTGQVLQTATVAAPGGVATFTLTAAQKDALEESGNTTLFARSKAGFFAGSAVSGQLDLGNLAPVARIAHGSLAGLQKGSVVQFTSASSDPDGNPLTLQWKLELVDDATDDADDVPTGLVLGGTGTAATFRPTIPDDGVYRVSLTASDTGGGVSTASEEFTVANVAPAVSLSAPRYVRPGAHEVTVAASDPDGILADLRVDDGDGLEAVPLGTTSFEVDFEEGVTYVFQAAATDDDGATAAAAPLTVDVDGEAPTTTLTAPAAPASGWFTGPVALTIGREDTGGSGVQATQVTVDGVTTTFPGAAPITQTVSGNGVHTVSVATIDNAGNVGETVTRTIRIDSAAPTVSITSPSATAYAPDAIPIGDTLFVPVYHGFQGSTITIRAAAADAHSGISKVEFYVDAGTPECVDVDGTDGWSCMWNVGNDAAYHTITARAFDAAGHDAVAAEQVYVLTVP